ncbi:hypothetical protein [Ralstonia pseudosolanacearum]|uniref:hypothetical protein n=1 Tax=Ralstonia pseudosolanacearum TaxID=1310165 RepID=UPI0013C42363|nr:hypothetical protein [Ralstonia pseudosolanacearum]
MGGKTATINAANGIANTGSIQHAGDLTLSTPGAVTNNGRSSLARPGGRWAAAISKRSWRDADADHDLSCHGCHHQPGHGRSAQ